MIYRPPPGQRVELHFRPSMRQATGLHLARGVVVVAGGGYRRRAMPRAWQDEHHHGLLKGSPVNALVELEDGRPVVVPRGQLFAREESE